MRKLTIGMATYDDYDGLYFTIQSIRMFHKEVLNDIEFVIIDNNPNDNHGKSIRNFTKWISEPLQYLPFVKWQATTVKNKVFELADTPYVLCVDSHVLIEQGAIQKLIKYYDEGKDKGNLLQGPLIYDDFKHISTHFDLSVWSDCMWGRWQTDERGNDPDNEPFEIPAQGMGLFSSRKDSWLGFNKEFRGFGGEEGYIHEKYRKNGKKCMCLPFLRWIHRFERPNPISYPNVIEQRFLNYYIGFKELDMDTKDLENHFSEKLSKKAIANLKKSLKITH